MSLSANLGQSTGTAISRTGGAMGGLGMTITIITMITTRRVGTG